MSGSEMSESEAARSDGDQSQQATSDDGQSEVDSGAESAAEADTTGGLAVGGVNEDDEEFDETEVQRELRSATLDRNGITAEIQSLQAQAKTAPLAMRKRIEDKLGQLHERKRKADQLCDSLNERLARLQRR